ncbi:hypothetical protein AMYX_12730 [Anaeromyxobacter diazotrophicus]|uniref:Uncharacterized protein n=1 Tax=Anaeromyxobacter diazotrophicus TaxID=2590199 RepID=A0A7I9VJE3_9BACT|nr:hypothetical protein AMYX_12730 [Anaeromyxobacter diazotrophicus]
MGKTGVATARVRSEMYRERQHGEAPPPSASPRVSHEGEGGADRRTPEDEAAERRRES